MGEFALYFVKSARKELERLPVFHGNRILKKISDLQNNPWPVNCKKLVGVPPFFRIRVGDYRIIYAIDEKKKIIEIFAVRHRKDAYE